MEFLKCAVCGKIVAMVKDGAPDTVCCGRSMARLVPNTSDGVHEKHVPVAEAKDGAVHVTVGAVGHPMLEEHHIEWIAIVTTAGKQRKILDPLGKPEADFALLPGETVKAVYEYCNLHGLWRLDVG